MKNIFENEKTSYILIFTGIILLITTIGFFLWKENIFDFSVSINSEKFGQFGDFIGGVIGTLWALAGVVLFYIALVEQRKDIKINSDTLKLQLKALNQQVEEFELQRSEMASSRKVYEQQSKTLKLQQFDSNFFSLLNLYLSIKQNLNKLADSRDYFNEIYDILILPATWDEDIERIHSNQMSNYEILYSKKSGMLSNYFRSVYRILKIIDSSIFLEENEKTYYAKIFRAQLSDFEQILLFYNSFSIRGNKTKRFILRYNLFKNIPVLILPYFKPFEELQGNYNIASLIDDIESFILTNIPKYFQLEYSGESISALNELFNCILSIKYEEKVILELHCDKDLKKNDFILNDNQLLKLFESIVKHFFIHRRYILNKDFNISKSKEETEKEKIFKISILFNEDTNFNFNTGEKE